MTKGLTGRRPRAYRGVEAPTPPNMVYETFAPSTVDQALVRTGYFEFNIGDLWLKRDETDPTPYEVWMLVDKDITTGSRLAKWIKIYPGAGGAAVTTHRTDAGDAIPAANLLNVIGGTGINTVGAGNTVTLNVNQEVATQYTTDDANTAAPVGNNLNISGGPLISTSSAVDTVTIGISQGTDGQIPIAATGLDTAFSTLTAGVGISIVNAANSITITNTGSSGGTDDFTTDAGMATQVANNINILGGSLLNTAGVGDTVTINIDQATNGQIPIGSTGNPTIFALPISTNGTITITGGANTLDLEFADAYAAEFIADDLNSAIPNASNELTVAGGGVLNTTAAGSTITVNLDDGSTKQIIVAETGQPSEYYDLISSDASVTIVQDTVGKTLSFTTAGGGGGAVNSVSGGTNINATGTAADPIINLDSSILQPMTNAAGTQGVYALGATDYITDRFLHAYGTANTFLGLQSGNMTLLGTNNVGGGSDVLEALTSGSNNSAYGSGSLILLQAGGSNSAFGKFSLNSLVSGDFNVALGINSGTNYTGGESNNIVIGNDGVLADSGQLRLGTTGTHNNAFIAGIWQNTPSGNIEIPTINSSGELGSFTGANGEILIGTTGGSPAWGTLTQGSGISITEGAGTITISTTGGTVNSVTAGTNLNNSGTASDPVINLDSSVLQPAFGSSTSPGSEGVYAIGGTDYSANRFLYNRGTHNTFLGELSGNFTGSFTGRDNTALGRSNLNDLDAGSFNLTAGAHAGESIQNTDYNVFLGYNSGKKINNTLVSDVASRNVFIGANAVANKSFVQDSVVIGNSSLLTTSSITQNDVIIGAESAQSYQSGNGNIILGYRAGSGLGLSISNNNIIIGAPGVNGEDNAIRIGSTHTDTFIDGIYDNQLRANNPRFMVIDSNDKLGYDDIPYPFASFDYTADIQQDNVTGDNTTYIIGTNATDTYSLFFDTTTPGDISGGGGTELRFTPTLLGMYLITWQMTIGGIDTGTTSPTPPSDPMIIKLETSGGSTIRTYNYINLPVIYNTDTQTFVYGVQIPFTSVGNYITFSFQLDQPSSAKTIDILAAENTFIQGTYISPVS